ncbi:MAG: hypothetical protein HYY16_08325 [Planctomycetes bacterium]|nr:hypothetical protein [Planctomycetota bacterium]
MRCIGCVESADGYAVIPGVGETGEIRFYCDACARRERVKMRYWDGRDLDVGGHRENPDLGPSFSTLVLSFEDVGRMRLQDVAMVLEWVDDAELASALVGGSSAVHNRVFSALRPERMRHVRELLAGERGRHDPRQAQEAIIQTIRRL